MNLGRVGLWAYQLDLVPSAQAQETAAEIEELGYGALWIPEMIVRELNASSCWDKEDSDRYRYRIDLRA